MGAKLKSILQDLIGEDILAIALVGLDGAVLESVTKGSAHDLHKVAGDLSALLKVGAYCARKLDGGDLDHVTMKTDSISVLTVSVGPGHYLATVIDARGNLARAQMQIRRRKTEIAEDLP